MGSYTTKYGLYKPSGSENVNIDQLGSNFDLIDAALGVVNCTSATRPASPGDGQLIYETDTKKLSYWNGTGWTVAYDPELVNSLDGSVTSLTTRTSSLESTAAMLGAGPGLVGGTPPAGTRLRMQAGTMTVSSNGNGDCGFNYPVAFPHGVLSASLQRRDFSYFATVLTVLNTIQTLGTLNFRVYTDNGAVAASLSSIPFAYSVIGW